MTHPLVKYRNDNGRQSQEALAKTLEVSSVTVSRWETGARKIDRAILPRIVERTGIPAAELRPDLAKLLAPAEVSQ
jgi:transcriptional regulator with XRE-family HTH domain